MLKAISFIRDVKKLVDTANAIRAEAAATGKPAYSLALTNRSFIAQVIGVLLILAIPFGFVLPIPTDQLVEFIVALASLAVGAFSWSGVERLSGATRAIWNRTQGVKAVEEAAAMSAAVATPEGEDKLSQALREAVATAGNRAAVAAAVDAAAK